MYDLWIPDRYQLIHVLVGPGEAQKWMKEVHWYFLRMRGTWEASLDCLWPGSAETAQISFWEPFPECFSSMVTNKLEWFGDCPGALSNRWPLNNSFQNIVATCANNQDTRKGLSQRFPRKPLRAVCPASENGLHVNHQDKWASEGSTRRLLPNILCPFISRLYPLRQ